jgi:hypothetical protein
MQSSPTSTVMTQAERTKMKLSDFKVGDFFALYTSYCPDGEACTDEEPCDECKRMSNKFRVDAVVPSGMLLFAPHLCIRNSYGCRLNSTMCSVVVDNEEDYKTFAPYSTMVGELTKVETL